MSQKTMLIILAAVAAVAAAWFFLRKKIASPNPAVSLPPVGYTLGGSASLPVLNLTSGYTPPPPVAMSSGSAVTTTIKPPSAVNQLGSTAASTVCAYATPGNPLCGYAGSAGGYLADKSVSAAKAATSAVTSVASKLKFW